MAASSPSSFQSPSMLLPRFLAAAVQANGDGRKNSNDIGGGGSGGGSGVLAILESAAASDHSCLHENLFEFDEALAEPLAKQAESCARARNIASEVQHSLSETNRLFFSAPDCWRAKCSAASEQVKVLETKRKTLFAASRLLKRAVRVRDLLEAARKHTRNSDFELAARDTATALKKAARGVEKNRSILIYSVLNCQAVAAKETMVGTCTRRAKYTLARALGTRSSASPDQTSALATSPITPTSPENASSLDIEVAATAAPFIRALIALGAPIVPCLDAILKHFVNMRNLFEPCSSTTLAQQECLTGANMHSKSNPNGAGLGRIDDLQTRFLQAVNFLWKFLGSLIRFESNSTELEPFRTEIANRLRELLLEEFTKPDTLQSVGLINLLYLARVIQNIDSEITTLVTKNIDDLSSSEKAGSGCTSGSSVTSTACSKTENNDSDKELTKLHLTLKNRYFEHKTTTLLATVRDLFYLDNMKSSKEYLENANNTENRNKIFNVNPSLLVTISPTCAEENNSEATQSSVLGILSDKSFVSLFSPLNSDYHGYLSKAASEFIFIVEKNLLCEIDLICSQYSSLTNDQESIRGPYSLLLENAPDILSLCESVFSSYVLFSETTFHKAVKAQGSLFQLQNSANKNDFSASRQEHKFQIRQRLQSHVDLMVLGLWLTRISLQNPWHAACVSRHVSSILDLGKQHFELALETQRVRVLELLKPLSEALLARDLQSPQVLQCIEFQSAALHVAVREAAAEARKVLPANLAAYFSGALVDVAVSSLLTSLLSVRDIAASQCTFLQIAIRKVLGNLCIDGPVETDYSVADALSGPVVHSSWVPQVETLHKAIEILDIPLREIRTRLHANEYIGFTAIGLSNLICALFQDTPLRADVLQEVKSMLKN